MKYLDDIGVEQLGVLEWTELINAYFYEPDKFKGYFRNQENAEFIGKRIERDVRDLNPNTILPKLRRKMELLTSVAAPESVKQYWKEALLENIDVESGKKYTPIAEKMSQIDEYEKALHTEFDWDTEVDDLGTDDANNPYAGQYLEKYVPPVFERNRCYGTTDEIISLTFDSSENVCIADSDIIRNFKQFIEPSEICAERTDNGIKVSYKFFDAYTESEQS